MKDCAHTPKYPDLTTLPSFEECKSRCSLVEDDTKVAQQRALTSKDGQTTKIDAPYWQKLNDAQKAAVVAHERAHPAIGMDEDCEGCADKVGGFYMRAWGYAPQVVQHAFSSLRVQRKREHGEIGANAAAGAQAAERALAERGLLGKSSTDIALNLRASKLAAQATADASKPATATTQSKGSRSPLTTKAPPAASPAGTKAEPASPSVGVNRVADLATPSTLGESRLAEAEADARQTPNTDGSLPSLPSSDGVAGPNVQIDDPGSKTPVAGRDIAGDVVSAVLGEDARPHAVKVLIGAGIAATLAIVLVIVVRRSA